MAIEDAAALGIIFNKQHFNGDISEALALYQDIRLPRVTRVQAAAAKAASNINERIGTPCPPLELRVCRRRTNFFFPQASLTTKTAALTKSQMRGEN